MLFFIYDYYLKKKMYIFLCYFVGIYGYYGNKKIFFLKIIVVILRFIVFVKRFLE